MTTDPKHPVLVAAHAVASRTADGEPVAMMVEAAKESLSQLPPGFAESIESVRIVKGIWPYKDPGRLVAEKLHLGPVTTAMTGIGGNATYDLVNQTAQEIASGSLTAAIVCGAETMRTRRADRAAGGLSTYLPEIDGASPDLMVGNDAALTDDIDEAAGVHHPVNFYAMVESVMRNQKGEDPAEHLARISALWASGSEVASQNPDAWLTDAVSANDIATASPHNRMVAAPYTKLLTSNINVDQGAAAVICSYRFATNAGLSDDDMVFLLSGSGAHDQLTIRARVSLDESPAFRSSAQTALDSANLSIDDLEHLDLYSCFPASVQLAQDELGIDPASRPFTITGGLTFAGGPFNGYCTQVLAKAVEILKSTTDRAFLYGNGGFFSKHSVLLLSGAPPSTPYVCSSPQAALDQLPTRKLANDIVAVSESGALEAYTVVYDRENSPMHAIASVLDEEGIRHWALMTDGGDIDVLLASDAVGLPVELKPGTDKFAVPRATLSSN